MFGRRRKGRGDEPNCHLLDGHEHECELLRSGPCLAQTAAGDVQSEIFRRLPKIGMCLGLQTMPKGAGQHAGSLREYAPGDFAYLPTLRAKPPASQGRGADRESRLDRSRATRTPCHRCSASAERGEVDHER
jgi:hypothetical protein